MKRMRCLAALAVLSVLAVAGTARAADPAVLKIGTEAGYPPFEFRDPSGALKGFDVDFGNALCAKIQIKCVWVVQDFDGLIPALQAGKIDIIISSMSVTPERSKAVDFTRSYYQSPSQLVAAKGSGISDDPATLKGKTIGVQSGTVHQIYVEQRIKGATDKAYDTLQNADLDLESGRVDAVLADKLAMYDWLAKEGTARGFDYAGKPIVDPLLSGDVAIAVHKGQDALKEKLDAGIDALLSDDAFDRMNAAYFPFSIRPR